MSNTFGKAFNFKFLRENSSRVIVQLKYEYSSLKDLRLHVKTLVYGPIVSRQLIYTIDSLREKCARVIKDKFV